MGKWYSMNQTSWKDESCILLQLDNNHTIPSKKKSCGLSKIDHVFVFVFVFHKPLLKNFQEGKLGY